MPTHINFWLLGALLATAFFQFALDSGGKEITIWAVFLFLALHIAREDCSARDFPVSGRILLALIAIILLLSWVFAYEATDTHRSLRLVKFLIIAVGVWCLARSRTESILGRALASFSTLVVLWQFFVQHFMDSPYGTFDNPHYLGYFSALLVPLMLVLIIHLSPPWRYLLLVVLVLDLKLILNDLTKPTIPLLSLGSALMLCLLLVIKGWKRWAITAVAAAAFMALLTLPQVASIIIQDERYQIWADSLRMSFTGPWTTWIPGHGLGSFSEHFPAASSPSYVQFSFPHNHLLQALYENGILGLALILLALTGMFFHSLQLYSRAASPTRRHTALANLAAFSVWLVFSGLAFGLYSSYTLYPLGFIIGIYLALASHYTRPFASRSSP